MSEFENLIRQQEAAQRTEAQKRIAQQAKEANAKTDAETAARNQKESHPAFSEIKERARDSRLTAALRHLWTLYGGYNTVRTSERTGVIFRKNVTHEEKKKIPFTLNYHDNSQPRNKEVMFESEVTLFYHPGPSEPVGVIVIIQYRDQPTEAKHIGGTPFGYSKDYSRPSKYGEDRQAGFSYEVRGYADQDGKNVFYTLDDLLIFMAGLVAKGEQPLSFYPHD